MGGAEEVCADDTVLRLGLLAYQLNINGGGVGRQDAVGPTYFFQLCKKVSLCFDKPSNDALGHD